MINFPASIGIILAAGASGAAVTATPHSPLAWIAPVACACFAALIVRGISITTPSRKKRVWMFEGLVTALSVLLTAVVVSDRGVGVMNATLCGVGIGSLGVGVISIARTAMVTMITNLAKSILSANDTPEKP